MVHATKGGSGMFHECVVASRGPTVASAYRQPAACMKSGSTTQVHAEASQALSPNAHMYLSSHMHVSQPWPARCCTLLRICTLLKGRANAES